MIDIRFVVPVLVQIRLICYKETAFTAYARKALIVPTMYTALTNTQRGHFDGIGPIGFVWAVTLFVACLKSVDLGFTPRHKIRYIGPSRQRDKESVQDIDRDLGWRGFFELLTKCVTSYIHHTFLSHLTSVCEVLAGSGDPRLTPYRQCTGRSSADAASSKHSNISSYRLSLSVC